MDDEERAFFKEELERLSGGPVMLMSGVSGEGVDDVLRTLRANIDQSRLRGLIQDEDDAEWQP